MFISCRAAKKFPCREKLQRKTKKRKLRQKWKDKRKQKEREQRKRTQIEGRMGEKQTRKRDIPTMERTKKKIEGKRTDRKGEET